MHIWMSRLGEAGMIEHLITYVPASKGYCRYSVHRPRGKHPGRPKGLNMVRGRVPSVKEPGRRAEPCPPHPPNLQMAYYEIVKHLCVPIGLMPLRICLG